jgi:hypothetical protein
MVEKQRRLRWKVKLKSAGRCVSVTTARPAVVRAAQSISVNSTRAQECLQRFWFDRPLIPCAFSCENHATPSKRISVFVNANAVSGSQASDRHRDIKIVS